MRKLTATLFAAFAIALVPASAAWAGSGNSSVDQYTEHVPTAGGGGGGGGGSGHSSIPPSTQQSLDSQGAAGQAAANLAESSAPVKRDSKAGNSGHGKHSRVDAVGTSSPGGSGGGSAGDAIGQAVKGDSGGGLGVLLPIILAVSVLGAVAIVAARRRGAGPGGDSQASA
jgi:hypothetical protein